ncbi:MAG: VWA domain-containing protein [Pyrinomonadaceae bacterium]
MKVIPHSIICLVSLLIFACIVSGQSGRQTTYSEGTTRIKPKPVETVQPAGDDTIKVETDLVTVPVRVTSKDSRPLADLKQSEFRLFENGVEQKVAYFSSVDQPFTVALLLDMSYSTVFKLNEIQAAALQFIAQLKENDRVTVIAFDEKPQVLCLPTSDRRVLKLAIEATRTGSGTSVYDSLDVALNRQLGAIKGRKAIVMLSDGVDTFSAKSSKKEVLRLVEEDDVIIYPLRYDTYDDVRKNRRKDAQIRYDEDDKPYIYEAPPAKGEREIDYVEAREFLDTISDSSGGRVFKVSSSTNLNNAFTKIAEELRKTYSLGYYPSDERLPGVTYTLKVRINRPNLNIRSRESMIRRSE